MTEVISDLLGKRVRIRRPVIVTGFGSLSSVANYIVTVGLVRGVAMTSTSSFALLIQAEGSKAEWRGNGDNRVISKGALFVSDVKTDEITIEDG